MTPEVETTTPIERESLFHCEHFLLWRLRGQSPFTVGAVDLPRVLVCVDGAGLRKPRGILTNEPICPSLYSLPFTMGFSDRISGDNSINNFAPMTRRTTPKNVGSDFMERALSQRHSE